MDVGDAEGATGEKYVGSPSATTRAMVAETSSGTVQLVEEDIRRTSESREYWADSSARRRVGT